MRSRQYLDILTPMKLGTNERRNKKEKFHNVGKVAYTEPAANSQSACGSDRSSVLRGASTTVEGYQFSATDIALPSSFLRGTMEALQATWLLTNLKTLSLIVDLVIAWVLLF